METATSTLRSIAKRQIGITVFHVLFVRHWKIIINFSGAVIRRKMV